MELTFEQLPKAVAQILEKLDRIEALLQHDKQPENNPGQLLNVQQVAELLLLSVPTVYGLIHQMKIPSYKKGKQLYFLHDEITEWIKTSRKKTMVEMEKEAEDYIMNSRKRKNTIR